MAGRRREPGTSGPAPHAPTAVEQDYLKAVWAAREWSDEPVTAGALGRRLGVAPSTVTETLTRLVARGWVTRRPYGPVALTPEGERLALAVVRRHRLLETWLVRDLGYRWDEVHQEAEVLEHAVSDVFVERLDARLGRPDRDPHGDPIPGPDGSVPYRAGVPLASLGRGERGVVVRVSDQDPQVLRECAACGVTLGSVVEAPAGLSTDALAAVRVTRL
ncbi:metal-dependent transcriptional regulator [Cellulomonas bogoriensis]|uniref:Manganese transport regulator n=1 Tax=Cellulomonas bogoriensis 69B4 = DSM 16987 TaxID=1386082 RepID=A0A0A0BXL6_9CELL|nr:metal-dependent transcriptional regulator [Cellulomonas bogoriensis]KGM13138.1 DtxR family transcriptional regulator [Cellulomonas bogoriensis 69B4 = DSM 16987]